MIKEPELDFILERLWKSYELTDNRRRRSFYILFTSTIIFSLLWATKPTTFKLPLIGTEVSFFSAMVSGPAFILIFSISYYYLCAHSLQSSVLFHLHFWKCNLKWFDDMKMTFSHIHGIFKQKDVTSILNIYLLFTGSSVSWDKDVPYIIRIIARLFINTIIILSLLVPLIIYCGMTFWIIENYSNYLSRINGRIIIGLYLYLSSTFRFLQLICKIDPIGKAMIS
jgi:hypothetical protein